MVVMTINALIPRLASVTGVVVTGSEGPVQTHVVLDADVGLTSHDVSCANATDIHTVAKGALRRRRGRLQPVELDRLEDAVRLYLGL